MRLLRWMICLLGLALIAAPAWALEEGPARVSGVVDCGGELAPADRMHCENVQLDAADEALNRIYGTLMRVLDARAKAMLLDGQRGWLVYRDKNLELFSSAASPGGQEGMARQIRTLRVLTEARVRELENLYRLFQDNGLLSVPEGQDDRFAVFDSPSSSQAPEASRPMAEVSASPVADAAVAAPTVAEPPPPAAEPSPQSAPAAQATEPAPAKGVIVLNGKVVRPSDFDVPPSPAVEETAPAEEAPAVDAVAAEPVAAAAASEALVSPEAAAASGAAPGESLPQVAVADPAPGGPEADLPAASPDEPLPPKTAIKSQAGLEALLGRHPLRLQWLSSQPLGEVLVEDRDGVLTLSGRQGGQGDRLEVEGVVSTVREDSFTLHGSVTTVLGFLNKGQPCVRKGQLWFVRKAGRPFWRLQSITNPCSGVSDYVDIYVGAAPVDEP